MGNEWLIYAEVVATIIAVCAALLWVIDGMWRESVKPWWQGRVKPWFKRKWQGWRLNRERRIR